MSELRPLPVRPDGNTRETRRRRRSRFESAFGTGLLVLATLCAATGAAMGAPQADRGKRLELRVGSFDPARERSPIPDRLRLEREPDAGHFIVQFHRDVDRGLLQRLRATGVEPLHYLPDRGYIVRVPPGRKRALRELPDARWVGPVQPGWKISPELGTRTFADPAGRREGGTFWVSIDLFPGADLALAEAAVAAVGAEPIRAELVGHTPRLRARATRGQIERIARLDAVAWIEELGEISKRNITASWVMQTDVVDSRTIWDHGLHGEGQIIGHIDGPLDMDSCYFRDPIDNTPGPSHRKVIAYRSSSGIGADGHGTHVAGSLAGDRFPIDGSISWNGHAYAAKISHANLGDISGLSNSASNLYEYLELAYGDGARVHTNSWGDDGITSYSTWARDIDEFSHDYEDSLVVFAVTNGSVLRSPENAKNVLAVGASWNGTSADSWASGGTGPTIDGRRKPEIYAPGRAILSARNISDCNVNSRTGTSMAAPVISAGAALVRQYFTEGWYPGGSPQAGDALSPSGALLKAMLLNATVDMANVSGYPSNLEGWGRLLLENSLYFDGDLRRLALLDDLRNAMGLSTGESSVFPLVVTGDDEELRVTLVFNDPPAPLLSISPPINDLDLVVNSPGGHVYRGNVFDTAAGVSVEGGSADAINNVEMIRIVSPEIGQWTVTVEGTAVNQGTQGYALVATGEVEAPTSGTLRYADHLVVDGDPLGDDDGYAEPGETFQLPVTLLNQRDETATGISTRMFAADASQAKVTDGQAYYPDIGTNAAAGSIAPHFTVTLSPDLSCGEAVRLDLAAEHDDGEDDSSFMLVVGSERLELGAPDVPIQLPAFSGFATTSEIPVAENLTVDSVEVSVSIDHEDVSELKVDLVSPSATSVTLHANSGAGVQDLITTYPTETFPDGPGAMTDFIGEPALGTWTLSVLDITAGIPETPAGTLVDWTLHLRFSDGVVCNSLDCGGDPVPAPVAPSMTVTPDGANDLLFEWDPVPGASAYRIWRSSNRDFSREELLAVTGDTSHLLAGAAALAGYYRVNAINSCEWESGVECDEAVPRAVSDTLLLDKQNASDLGFDWSALGEASAYRLYVASSPAFADDTMLLETGSTTATVSGALDDPADEYYLVRAVNSCAWEGP